MKEQPIPVIYRSLRMLAKDQAQFIWQNLGETITRYDGRGFKIFRQVVMKPQEGQPSQPGAVFCVWFYTRTSPAVTVAMSWLTLFCFAGMKGFRSKIWLYDEASGEFGGIYEWDTLEQAEEYGKSFAMKLSSLRSIPGKFRKEAFLFNDPRSTMHRAVSPVDLPHAPVTVQPIV
jgi:hypothetical protein